MKEFRNIVIKKFLNGLLPGAIFRELKHLGLKRNFIYYTIKRYKETSSVEDRRRSGRPRSKRTPAVIKIVRERIRRNRQRSVRKLANDLKMSIGAAYNLLTKDLGCKPYKKRKVHGVSAAAQKKRRDRANQILAWHAGDEFIFSDEKLFVLEQHHNAQNDRLWSVSFKDIPENERSVPRFQSASSVMVWGAICKRGKLPLVFIEKGVKINAQYYKTEVLEKVLLPNLQKLYGDDYYVFQQDGAPAHTSNVVQDWCETNLTDFLKKDEWPPSSPDLNPLDFFVWSYMLSRINEHKITSLIQFKKIILRVWDQMPMDSVRAACESFQKRLKLIKKVKGGVIPQKFL